MDISPNSPKIKQRFGQILVSICQILNSAEQEDKECINKVSYFICCYKKYTTTNDLYKRLLKGKDKIDIRLALRFIRIWIYQAFIDDFYKTKKIKDIINHLKYILKLEKFYGKKDKDKNTR